MQVNLNVDENLVCLITTATKKDISSIITEALNQWAKNNLPRCPIDEKYCASPEPCNNCRKMKIK